MFERVILIRLVRPNVFILVISQRPHVLHHILIQKLYSKAVFFSQAQLVLKCYADSCIVRWWESREDCGRCLCVSLCAEAQGIRSSQLLTLCNRNPQTPLNDGKVRDQQYVLPLISLSLSNRSENT